ncbi:GNAT family N-acetyltransferase [Sesbania bispinosa]|nr:GNAT family N-acetyltransferase [Sesbania bispinosa]
MKIEEEESPPHSTLSPLVPCSTALILQLRPNLEREGWKKKETAMGSEMVAPLRDRGNDEEPWLQAYNSNLGITGTVFDSFFLDLSVATGRTLCFYRYESPAVAVFVEMAKRSRWPLHALRFLTTATAGYG